MTEHLLSTLGLALRAGAVAVGEEPVGAAARAKKARVNFTARDAAASSVRRAYSFGRAGSCLCLPFPADKETIGRALVCFCFFLCFLYYCLYVVFLSLLFFWFLFSLLSLHFYYTQSTQKYQFDFKYKSIPSK